MSLSLGKRLVAMLAMAGIGWAATTATPQRIVIIGDSTVCDYAANMYPQTGWGQVLKHYFRTGSVTVINHAIGGRSSRSFIEGGRWTTTLATLQKGDILMVQFGHNDRDFSKAERYTDTTDYKKYLAQYATEARAKGAHPIFVTPMNMNTWTGSAVREVFTEGANNYRAAMIHAAASLKVPVYKTFWRVSVPVCAPAALDISMYLFVNAMTTVSAVVFLYAPHTALASVAVLNMDDAGEVASAAAMGMMIVYTSAAVRLGHMLLTRGLLARAQAWRRR